MKFPNSQIDQIPNAQDIIRLKASLNLRLLCRSLCIYPEIIYNFSSNSLLPALPTGFSPFFFPFLAPLAADS